MIILGMNPVFEFSPIHIFSAKVTRNHVKPEVNDHIKLLTEKGMHILGRYSVLYLKIS